MRCIVPYIIDDIIFSLMIWILEGSVGNFWFLLVDWSFDLYFINQNILVSEIPKLLSIFLSRVVFVFLRLLSFNFLYFSLSLSLSIYLSIYLFFSICHFLSHHSLSLSLFTSFSITLFCNVQLQTLYRLTEELLEETDRLKIEAIANKKVAFAEAMKKEHLKERLENCAKK